VVFGLSIHLALLIGSYGSAAAYPGAGIDYPTPRGPELHDSTDSAATRAQDPVVLSPDAPLSSSSGGKGDGDGHLIGIGLPQVIRACVLSDPRILAALTAVDQARADHLTASLLPNPTLQISQALLPLPGSSFNAESRQGGPPQLDVGLSYSLETLLFGTRSAGMEATRLGIDVALGEYAEITRQRILEAIGAYYDVLESRQLVEIAHQDLDQLERIEGITQRRVQLGSVGKVEVERVHVALLGGKRRLLAAAAELDNARSRLRAQLGRAIGAERADAAGNLEIHSPPPPPDLRRALELAESHRPDLLALQRRVTRAQAELERERSAAWPSLSVSAGYTRQFQRDAIGFPDVSSWGAGLEMSLPIFARNQGNIARARSAVRQAEYLLSAARIDLRAELEQAIRSYAIAHELVTALDVKALAAASSARQRIEEAYGLGGRTLLEVLDAQAAFREVLRDHIIARADLLRALHRLNAIASTELL
jgi:cobalt-zinc-cadmium efflux system outer membrane protein